MLSSSAKIGLDMTARAREREKIREGSNFENCPEIMGPIFAASNAAHFKDIQKLVRRRWFSRRYHCDFGDFEKGLKFGGQKKLRADSLARRRTPPLQKEVSNSIITLGAHPCLILPTLPFWSTIILTISHNLFLRPSYSSLLFIPYMCRVKDFIDICAGEIARKF